MPLFRRPRRALGLIPASIGLAAVLMANPVAAGDPGKPPFLLWTGKFGVVALIDNPTFAGAICTYASGPNPDLLRIKVRRPIVFAYDRTSGVDRQTVGWRYELEYSDDLDTWTRFYRSDIRTATATDLTNADFRPRSHSFTSTHSYYRALVRVVWYKDGVVNGRAGLYPFYYGVVVLDSFEQYVPWYCPDPLV